MCGATKNVTELVREVFGEDSTIKFLITPQKNTKGSHKVNKKGYPAKQNTIFLLFAETILMRGHKVSLILLHSEWPKLHRVLAILSAKGLKINMKYNIKTSSNSSYTSSSGMSYRELTEVI